MPTISESLAGRAAILGLSPLSEAEVEGASGCGFLDWFEAGVEVGESSPLSRSDYLTMVCRGGFPETVGLPDTARRLWCDRRSGNR